MHYADPTCIIVKDIVKEVSNVTIDVPVAHQSAPTTGISFYFFHPIVKTGFLCYCNQPPILHSTNLQHTYDIPLTYLQPNLLSVTHW